MTRKRVGIWTAVVFFAFGKIGLAHADGQLPAHSAKIAMLSVAKNAPLGFTRVTNQADTLQCWAIAIASEMDTEASRIAGHPLKTSPRYLFYIKTLDEVTNLIVTGDFTKHQGSVCEKCQDGLIYYEQGGSLPDAVEAMSKRGMVPEQAYPSFIKNDENLFVALNTLIGKYERSPRMPRNKPSVTANVAKLLNHFLGKPPQAFIFNGKRYTSHEFANAYLPSWRGDKAIELDFSASSKKSKSVTTAYDGKTFTSYITNNRAEVIEALAQSLAAGRRPLVATWYMDDAFGETGIGFKVNGTKAPRNFDADGPDALDHYMLALSGQENAQGNLDRVFVRNTFDISKQEGFGYQWMERDYFPFISGVEIPADLVDKFTREGLLPED